MGADMRTLISALWPIWHERADMGADMRILTSAHSCLISPHIGPLMPY